MGDLLAGLARKSATARARETEWFSDLEKGLGRAAGMPESVRQALVSVTADIADEKALRNRELAVARAAEQKRARAAERQLRAREWRAFNGRLVRDAFGELFTRTIAAVFIVGLTPVAASFATITPGLGNIKPVVFFVGETGSTTGDGPWTLYSILLWCVGGCLVVAFLSDIVLGSGPSSWPERMAVAGALIGLAVFCYQWYLGTLQWFSWNFAPVLGTAGYVLASGFAGTRARRARAQARAKGSGE